MTGTGTLYHFGLNNPLLTGPIRAGCRALTEGDAADFARAAEAVGLRNRLL